MQLRIRIAASPIDLGDRDVWLSKKPCLPRSEGEALDRFIRGVVVDHLGLSQSFFRPVCQLRERAAWPKFWLWTGLPDGQISILSCVETGSAERNSALNRARKNFATGPSRPLNHMQVELLKRYRGDHASEAVVTGIHLTINDIATGLRNSRKLTPLPSEAASHGARRSRSVPR